MNNMIQLRIDPKTKKLVAHIFQNLGLDLSSGIKIYFHQVLLHKGIPFPLLTENGFTPAQENKILAESRRTRKIYESGKRKSVKSINDLRKEIMGS